MKNTSSFPLLAGPSSIHLDGTFVAKGRLETTNPGEEFKVSLGIDGGMPFLISSHDQRCL